MHPRTTPLYGTITAARRLPRRYSLVTRLQLLVVPDGEQARIVLNHVVHVALKLTKGKGLPHLHHHAHLRVKVHLLDEVVGSLLKQSLEDDHEAASGVLQ